ncbi:MAG: hypothetical protein HRT95_05660 [Moritella sp.]|uniref:hypothetical protein n=1 Tax=Moritella sp. TaxID=78556 RepID=UPI001DC14EDF|nr:hypothetical protein [Moritella sp.]NQZ49677.1 hypothetical protein [Moritella sp.]
MNKIVLTAVIASFTSSLITYFVAIDSTHKIIPTVEILTSSITTQQAEDTCYMHIAVKFFKKEKTIFQISDVKAYANSYKEIYCVASGDVINMVDNGVLNKSIETFYYTLTELQGLDVTMLDKTSFEQQLKSNIQPLITNK